MKTKNVYIITKSKLAYNAKGLKFVCDSIIKNMNETSDLTVCQGIYYQDAEILTHELKNHPDAYVVISNSQNNVIIYGENIPILIENLKMTPKRPVWDTIADTLNISSIL